MNTSRTEAFRNELVSVIQRYAFEDDLSIGEAIGIIEIVKGDLLEQARNHANRPDDEPGELE